MSSSKLCIPTSGALPTLGCASSNQWHRVSASVDNQKRRQQVVPMAALESRSSCCALIRQIATAKDNDFCQSEQTIEREPERKQQTANGQQAAFRVIAGGDNRDKG